MSTTYIVKPEESITDVVLNATGSLINWDAVLTANEFTDWTPRLKAGQSVIIPDTVNIDSNTKRQLSSYPASNSFSDLVVSLIAAVFNQINSNWILQTGYWNDSALWLDNKNWKDS